MQTATAVQGTQHHHHHPPRTPGSSTESTGGPTGFRGGQSRALRPSSCIEVQLQTACDAQRPGGSRAPGQRHSGTRVPALDYLLWGAKADEQVVAGLSAQSSQQRENWNMLHFHSQPHLRHFSASNWPLVYRHPRFSHPVPARSQEALAKQASRPSPLLLPTVSQKLGWTERESENLIG